MAENESDVAVEKKDVATMKRGPDELAGDWTSVMAAREGLAVAQQEIGWIRHYCCDRMVAAVELTSGSLALGDTVHIQGFSSDFVQTIDSLQRDGQPVEQASVGQRVDVPLAEHARVHDVVYKVGQ